MFSQALFKIWKKRRQARAASLGFGGHHSQMTCWNLATAVGNLKVCILDGDICSWPDEAEFSGGAEEPGLCFPLCQRGWKLAATQRARSLLLLRQQGKGSARERASMENTQCARVLPVFPALLLKEALAGCSLTEEEAAGI